MFVPTPLPSIISHTPCFYASIRVYRISILLMMRLKLPSSNGANVIGPGNKHGQTAFSLVPSCLFPLKRLFRSVYWLSWTLLARADSLLNAALVTVMFGVGGTLLNTSMRAKNQWKVRQVYGLGTSPIYVLLRPLAMELIPGTK